MSRSKRNKRKEQLTGFWEQMPERTKHIICLLFLLILPTILFHQTFWGDKMFMAHDIIQWKAGSHAIFAAQKKYHVEPLWDTSMFSGMPAYMIIIHKVVPNLDTLISKLFNGIFPSGQFWVLLIGLYLFFIIQDIKPVSATLGSVLIGFTTYIPIIIGAGHNTKFIAFSYIPWVLIGYYLLTRKKKHRLVYFFIFALALVLELRAGHPQVTYYFLYLLGFWWLFDLYKAYKEKTLGDWAVITGWLLAAGVIALLANAQPYWSIFEYSKYSQRGGSVLHKSSGLNLNYAMAWSQGWGELLTLIIPGLYGGSSSQGTYWGSKPFTAGPHYLGAIAVLLFVIGIIKSRNSSKPLFLTVGIIAILFSLGKNLPLLNVFMFKHMPYFNKFRTPEMWLLVTVFCFSVIAVYGLEWIIDKISSLDNISLKDLYLPLGIVFGIAIIFALGSTSMFSFVKKGEQQTIAQEVAQQNNVSPNDPRVLEFASNYIVKEKMKREAMAKKDSFRFLIYILIGGGLIAAAYASKIPVGYAALGLTLLASIDMLSVGTRYFGTSSMISKSAVHKQENVVERERTPIDTFLENAVKTKQDWKYRVLPLADNPFNNAVPAYFYPSIGGYTAVKLGNYQDLINNALFTGDNGLNMGVLDMLNVKYITNDQPFKIPGLKVVYRKKDGTVMENENVLPKAFYADSLVYAKDQKQALEDLNKNFNPHKYAIVQSDSTLNIAKDTSATVSVTNYRPDEIKLLTNHQGNGFLVLSEIYYPAGWNAYIDGKKSHIYETNFVLRGIFVPGGKHTITFVFRPQSYYTGEKIAWGASLLLLGIGIVGFIGFFRDKRENSEE